MTNPPDYSQGNADYFSRFRLAFGQTPTVNSFAVRGLNEAVGTSFETIWTEGGIYEFPSSAQQMTVSSDNANDTSEGTGCRKIVIVYLDSNYDEQQEIVILNGTTPVTTINSILRINQVFGATNGSNTINIGNIYIGTGTVTAGKPANVFGIIEADSGLSMMSVYTVPRSKNLVDTTYFIASESNKVLTLRFRVFNVLGGGEQVETFRGVFDTGATLLQFVGGLAGPKTDIRVDCKISSGTTLVTYLNEIYLRNVPGL